MTEKISPNPELDTFRQGLGLLKILWLKTLKNLVEDPDSYQVLLSLAPHSVLEIINSPKIKLSQDKIKNISIFLKENPEYLKLFFDISKENGESFFSIYEKYPDLIPHILLKDGEIINPLY